MDDNLIYFNTSRIKNLALTWPASTGPMKVYFFAIGDVDETHRAEYQEGELARLLGLSPQRLKSAIKSAIQIGLILPESTSTCIAYGDKVRFSWELDAND